ncbi:hypothetical protein K469DRAFT_565840, partial [Zopfia rhizophila CBS 207.26]
CCFRLTGAGNISGHVGQLRDGTVQIGGSSVPSLFCLDKTNGFLTDSWGRVCGIGIHQAS